MPFGSAKWDVNDTDYSFGVFKEMKTGEKKTSSVTTLITSDHTALDDVEPPCAENRTA